MYGAKGAQRLYTTHNADLARETIEDTLRKFSPEGTTRIVVNMGTHDNLRTVILLKGMLDAIGDVGSQAHLCLHPHICLCSLADYLLKQLATSLLVFFCLLTVIYHIEGYKATIELRIAHHDGEIDEGVAGLVIFYRNENLLVIIVVILLAFAKTALEDYISCCLVSNDGRDDAGEEYHHHNAIQHVVIDDVELHAYHHDGNTTSSMG